MVTTRIKRPPRATEPTAQPQWQSPHKPVPTAEITSPDAKLNVLQRAQAIAGIGADPSIVASIIIAQALDRLSSKLVEAAAVNRYRSADGP